MTGDRFEVQARRRVRRDGVVVRDETDHAVATDLDDAHALARSFADRGYTSWVFRVQPGSGTAPDYRMVEMLRPASDSRPHSRPS